MTVAELLSDESKWTNGMFARDARGRSMNPRDAEASCWCLIGAVLRCYGTNVNRCIASLNRLKESIGPDVEAWNDAPERTFADVRRVIEEAGI